MNTSFQCVALMAFLIGAIKTSLAITAISEPE